MAKQADAEKTPFRFSLRKLFFVTSMVVGLTLLYIGKRYTGQAVMLVSIYLFFETRKSSLAELIEKKRQARSGLSLGLIFAAWGGCCLWWQEEDFRMPLFLGVVLSIMGLAQWVESRTLKN